VDDRDLTVGVDAADVAGDKAWVDGVKSDGDADGNEGVGVDFDVNRYDGVGVDDGVGVKDGVVGKWKGSPLEDSIEVLGVASFEGEFKEVVDFVIRVLRSVGPNF